MSTTISQTDMAALVAAGKATQWTQPLSGAVPLAARVDDTWYVVVDPTDTSDTATAVSGDYQLAPAELAAVLDHVTTVLDLADAAVANADLSSRHVADGGAASTDAGQAR